MIALVALAAMAPIYSNVFMHPETGDMLGMEVRLHDGIPPTVDFALCEGSCYGAKGIAVTPRTGGFDFVYDEKLVDQHGKLVPSIALRFSARLQHGRLLVSQVGGSREVLKLRPKPWGLDLIDEGAPSVP